jgi:WD40 repeat protein
VLVAASLAYRQSPGPLSSGATGHPTPSRPLPGATESAGPSAAGPWRLLAASDTVGAEWSPDGRSIAVLDQVTSGTPEQQHVTLFARSGEKVRSLQGEAFAWVDSSRFVLTSANSSYLGSIGSADLRPIPAAFPSDPTAGIALSNGQGAVALVALDPNAPAKTTFVVWTESGESGRMSGRPEAWSPDGSRLAVWHAEQRVGPQGVALPPGSVEVLSWPGLERVATVSGSSYADKPISFDPTGPHVLISRSTSALPKYSVADATTGRLLGPANISGFAPVWDAGGHLFVPSPDGSVRIWSLSDAQPVTKDNVGDTATGSADGSLVVLYFAASQEAKSITLVRAGAYRALKVPGPIQFAPAPSPDGSGLVVFCEVGAGEQALLLVT